MRFQSCGCSLEKSGLRVTGPAWNVGMSLQGCKGQRGTNPPGALAREAALPDSALYRERESSQTLLPSDASTAFPVPTAPRLLSSRSPEKSVVGT